MARTNKTDKATQNLDARPHPGSTAARVFGIADEISGTKERPATRKEVIDAARDQGIDTGTASAHFAAWSIYHNVDQPAEESPADDERAPPEGGAVETSTESPADE